MVRPRRSLPALGTLHVKSRRQNAQVETLVKQKGESSPAALEQPDYTDTCPRLSACCRPLGLTYRKACTAFLGALSSPSSWGCSLRSAGHQSPQDSSPQILWFSAVLPLDPARDHVTAPQNGRNVTMGFLLSEWLHVRFKFSPKCFQWGQRIPTQRQHMPPDKVPGSQPTRPGRPCPTSSPRCAVPAAHSQSEYPEHSSGKAAPRLGPDCLHDGIFGKTLSSDF